MSKRTIILLFVLMAAPLIIYFLLPSDESRIRKLFRDGARAIEREDLDVLMAKVSFNYRDEHGLTYLSGKELMKSIFQRMDHINADYENLRIEVKKDKTATADMDVWITATVGTDKGYIMGDPSNPVHLTFKLEKERTKWSVTKTEGLPLVY